MTSTREFMNYSGADGKGTGIEITLCAWLKLNSSLQNQNIPGMMFPDLECRMEIPAKG
jgi:hypothetical protein